MKIAQIEALPGQKAFGFVTATQTHGGFDVHFPLHIVAGRRPGPTLLVVAGMSGLEIEPALILPQVVGEIDPAGLAGTLLVVPLFNTSGFEFEQVNAVWDDKDLTRLGRGRADGTVSEQLLDCFYTTAVAAADAVIDIRTGALWGYFRYAGVYESGQVARSAELARALGLPQVLLGQPLMARMRARRLRMAKQSCLCGSAEVRGSRLSAGRHAAGAECGAEWVAAPGDAGRRVGERRRTRDDSSRAHLREGDGTRGLTFMDKGKRGRVVGAGDVIGFVKHPFTGDIVHEFRAVRGGVMLDAGASWPIVPEEAVLAILGDPEG